MNDGPTRAGDLQLGDGITQHGTFLGYVARLGFAERTYVDIPAPLVEVLTYGGETANGAPAEYVFQVGDRVTVGSASVITIPA